jgi:mRNA-degrading endonuclease toxin of MazEF toxin-antitoxin module
MSKVKDNSGLMLIAEQRLSDLKTIIGNMDEKRGRSFLLWLEQQNKYLQWEVGFDPLRLKRYKRGEVVHIHFGFNTGSEHGGPHWGVILDDNKKSSPTAVVMPLGSLAEGQTEADVHPDDIFLGQIPSINNKLVFGIPTQIRAISKLRITKPKKAKDKTYELTNDQLDLIDQRLYKMFFSKSKVVHEFALAYLEASASESNEKISKHSVDK